MLFVLKTNHEGGKYKAFLHDKATTAHPEEKEYLIGDVYWIVEDVKEETLEHRAGPLKVTVIYLKDYYLLNKF